jgi:hypothetical protein
VRCLLCNSPQVEEINRGIRNGWNSGEYARQMSKYGKPVDRQVFYNHRKKHVDGMPGTALVAVPHDDAKPLVIRKSSNSEFLETVRDVGLARVERDPEGVTLDQALKAASILEGRKSNHGDQINLLVKVVTGHASSAYTIEGEYTEVNS